jgi:gliding motility-associated-like protein
VTATYVDENNNMVDSDIDFTAQAPLDVTFRANPTDMGDHTPAYEWHFRKEGAEQDLLVRYEEDTQYTFTESGKYAVILKTILDSEGTQLDSVSISVFIADSYLEFPNAFSPNNGDELNNIFKAKKHKSLVKFHAYIINRWGQKLYEWTDPDGGWDGKYKGKDVKDGVYFLLCKARGADGKEYNIRKDVNLLRKFIEGGSTGGTN